MIAKIEVYFIVFLLLTGAAAGAYFYAKHQGVMEERARWEAKQATATKEDLASLRQAVETGNAIALKTAEAVNQRKADKIIDRGVIQREIQTNTLYAADCFPDTGRLQWNRISAGLRLMPAEPASPKPSGALPQGNGSSSPGLQGGNSAP